MDMDAHAATSTWWCHFHLVWGGHLGSISC